MPRRADPRDVRGIRIAVVTVSIGLAAATVGAPASCEDAEQQAAIARLEQNRASYEKAQEQLAKLEAEYTRGRTQRKLAGEPRREVVQGIAKAKQELEAARAEHAELFEAARKTGVSWKALERYENLPAPPAAPNVDSSERVPSRDDPD